MSFTFGRMLVPAAIGAATLLGAYGAWGRSSSNPPAPLASSGAPFTTAAEEPDVAADANVFAGVQSSDIVHSFYFARAQYPSGGFGRGGGWATDWPTADRVIISVLGRLTSADVSPRELGVRLDDPELRRYPFLYAVEVGSMNLRDNEIEALRNYLLAGGFLVVDDFWGSYQWENFAYQITQVLPEFEIVELPLDHPLFSVVYEVDEIVQVPNIGNGRAGGPTYEQDGYEAKCFGIFDDKGRLMVVINWNTDLGDAWEWAEDPSYPLDYSTYAYRMGANFIFYAMTR
jgi:hypothetical protein